MRVYEYKALKAREIRLIELKASSSCNNSPELPIQIHHVSLDDRSAAPYEALSYVWGDTTGNHPLYCGDGSYLLITESLFCALRSLRWRSESRMLWVDAICICQDDLEERGTQVALMRHIYQTSKCTVVYLGDEADDSSLAISFLEDTFHRTNQKIIDWEKKGPQLELLDSVSQEQHKKIAEMKKISDDDMTDLEEGQNRIDRMKVTQICSKSIGSSKEELFRGFPQKATQRALVALLSRPWFQRVWIIQEFVVAPHVVMYCGRRSVIWESVLSLFCYSFEEAKLRWRGVIPATREIDFYRGLSQMIKLHGLWNKHHDPIPHPDSLLVLLSECRTASATRPVDKIYALLGISCDSAGFKPDYYKSKAEVYLHFAEWLISKQSCKALLYETARSDRVAGDLPSWVPDWSEIPTRTNIGQQISRTGKWLFSAGGKQHRDGPKETVHLEGKVLTVTGYVLQTILILGYTENRAAQGTPNVTHLLNVLKDVQTCKQNLSMYPTGEEIDDALAIVLEADQPRDEVTNFWDNDNARDIVLKMELENLENQGADAYITQVIKSLSQESPEIIKNIVRAISGRRLAVTDKSYVGLVPTEAKRGDKICVFYGFSVPFVLRKRGRFFSLIGDCYMHGLMQGETLEADPPPELREFKIH